MLLNIKIENFEGPFDLLLHLIKKNEMNIYDIRISEITNQYLEYLNQMKEFDLEIASEFIVTASTLLAIKSKELLPKPKKEEDEEVDEEDMKQQFIKKLIEYNKFKSAAEFLKERSKDSGIIFTKKAEIIETKNDIDISEVLEKVTLLKLYNLFNNLMITYNNKLNTRANIPSNIHIDEYKLEDKIEHITRFIINNNKANFSKIIDECSSKMEVIVSFLALLEMIKLKTIKVVQQENFNEIYFERNEFDE